MTHWLEIVREIAGDQAGDTAAPALIIGDPLHRAADVCERAGLTVVRAIPPHGFSPRHVERHDDQLVVRVSPDRLPFAEQVFGLVVAHATVEFSHDDRRVITEFHRILQPGGRLVVRLPRRGALTALDALNLYRYGREIVGQGDVPPEALPIGWRRHYLPADIDAIFDPSGLQVDRVVSGGLAIGEALYTPALIANRTLVPHPGLAQHLRSIYARLGDLDERLPGPATWVVTASRQEPYLGDPVDSEQ